MDHNSVFSSAQAMRLPLPSKYIPLARPAGSRNVDNLPSTLHFMMRLFGWSVKKTLPSLSHVGPSANWKSPESFSSFAPAAMTLLVSAAMICAAANRAAVAELLMICIFMVFDFVQPPSDAGSVTSPLLKSTYSSVKSAAYITAPPRPRFKLMCKSNSFGATAAQSCLNAAVVGWPRRRLHRIRELPGAL